MIRYVLKTLGSFRSALVVGVGLPFLIASAYAQEEATTDRVIVTGSYIPTAETESALPVTVYTAEVLQKQGANTPVEGLRQLPSFVGNTQTENTSNGGDGTATINLRAVGSENTLTLINGRRAFSFNDINAIPIGALARTEVLKDGASAVYGSDGVAGVVNFILINGPGEKPYEGAELYALYGNTTDTDAHVRSVYLRGGVTGLDGKVSIAAAGEYYSRANLFSRDREISVTGDTSNNPTGLGFGGLNNNSPTYGGRVSVGPNAASLGVIGTGALVLTNLSNGSNITPGSYRRFEPGPAVLPPNGTLPGDFPPGTDPSRFNFRAFSPAIPAMEKAMYFVTGRYKIFGDGLQLYGDIMYSKVKQDNGLAGSPFTMNAASNGLTEARNSPFNPFGNNLTSLAYRLQQELANRRSFYDKDYYRYVVGIDGNFNIKDNGFIDRWGYDSGYVYERLNYQRTDSGDARRSFLRTLIGNGSFNPFIGQFAPVTGTALQYNNTNSAAPNFQNGVPIGTLPYDNTIAALDWTQGGAAYTGHSFFYERDWLADIKVNAHLFPNLWNGGINIAAGFEKREINQKQIPDPVQASNDQLGFNQSPLLKYRQEVESIFFELGLPLVTSAMNVPFIRSLDLDIAWRREEFNDTNLLRVTGSPLQETASFVNENPDENFGGSPRVSLRYQPIADLTLRASWGQSFRSPSPNELFSPVFQNFPQLFDPIQGVTLQPPSGVWEGGFPGLIPETTDAYSGGVVWTPKFLPGFTMTLDVYQLFTTNLVLDADSFAQVLLTTNVVDPDGCGLGVLAGSGPGLGVTRDASGALQCVDSGFGNAGKRFVEGMDMTAVYELPTENWGKFTFSGGWNHFFSWKAQPGTGQPFNSFLGNYNNGTLPLAPGAIPWNKAFLRAEWDWRHFLFGATGNYVGDFRDDPAFDSIARDEPRNVPSYITLDMQLSYEFVKPAAEPMPTVKDSKDSKSVMQPAADTSSIWQRMLWGTTLTVGVNNAFDRQPPSVIGAFNDNYDTSLYSIRNRYWYVSLKKKF